MPLPAIPLLTGLVSFIKDPRVIIIAATLALVTYSVKATVDNIQEQSFLAGQLDERNKWTERKEAEDAAREREILRLQQLVSDTESDLTSRLSKIENDLTEKFKGVIDEKDTTIASLRNGNLRLSIELRNKSAEAATTELAGAAAVRYATYRAELSEAASEFLITYAADADAAATALGSCQDTIRLYREKVAEYNSKYATYSF